MNTQDREPPLAPGVFLAEDPIRTSSVDQVAPQVTVTTQTGRIIPPPLAPASAVVNAPARTSIVARLCWLGLGLGFVVWLFVDLYLWLVSAFDQSTTVGVVASSAAVIALLAACILIAREMRSYFAFKEVEAHQKFLDEARSGRPQSGKLAHVVRDILTDIPKSAENVSAIETFQRQIQRHHSAAQQIDLLSRTVMSPLDRRAEAAIRRASTRAFGITAISPTAVTDAIFFIATSVRMVREIAACYGHRPTTLATMRLLRRLVGEAGKLGAVDLASTALTQHLGGAVERVAAGAAEALYATQRMARLGLVTMALCRPVPFESDEIPGMMSSLVGGLFKQKLDASQPA